MQDVSRVLSQMESVKHALDESDSRSALKFCFLALAYASRLGLSDVVQELQSLVVCLHNEDFLGARAVVQKIDDFLHPVQSSYEIRSQDVASMIDYCKRAKGELSSLLELIDERLDLLHNLKAVSGDDSILYDSLVSKEREALIQLFSTFRLELKTAKGLGLLNAGKFALLDHALMASVQSLSPKKNW